MNRFFKWKGFVILFLTTAAPALLSLSSCSKKGNQSHTDPFAEPKKANVTLRVIQQDTSIFVYGTQAEETINAPQ